MAFFTFPHSSVCSSNTVVLNDLSLSFLILSFAWPSWPVNPSSEFLNSVIIFAIQNLFSSFFVIVSFLILMLFITFLILFSCLSMFSCRSLNFFNTIILTYLTSNSEISLFLVWFLDIDFVPLIGASFLVCSCALWLFAEFFFKYQIYFNI